jgi:hypothetical protein
MAATYDRDKMNGTNQFPPQLVTLSLVCCLLSQAAQGIFVA